MIETEATPFSVLGIPIAPLTLEETLEKIEEMVEEYKKNGRPHYIATLNVDFLANAHGWLWDSIGNPELLSILRNADLVTLDGMPLVGFAKALGVQDAHRVTGVDLITAFVASSTASHHSLFLLGGDEKVLRLTALYLEAENPRIKIVGTSSKPIPIGRGELQKQIIEDEKLIEEINKAKPSILLLNLGHPKQEIWFERVRDRLDVPVSIGVGGSFNLITGVVSRAPLWIQRLGLEWLYRFYQEPKRLFKRYARDLFKFPVIAFPPLIYSFMGRKNKENFLLQDPLLFIASHQTFSMQKLPPILDIIAAEELKRRDGDLLAHEKLVLDFSKVGSCSLEGLGWIINLWQKGKREGRQVLALSVPMSIRTLFRLHRIWDLLETDYCETTKHALEQINYQEQFLGFYDAVEQTEHGVHLYFFGNLDRHSDSEGYLEKRGALLQNKKCIVDLSYCTYIDNSGLIFLQKLKNFCQSNLCKIEIRGLKLISV